MLSRLNEKSTEEQNDGIHIIDYIYTSESICESYRKEPALSAIKAAMKSNDFKCYTMQGDDIDTMMEFGLIFW